MCDRVERHAEKALWLSVWGLPCLASNKHRYHDGVGHDKGVNKVRLKLETLH